VTISFGEKVTQGFLPNYSLAIRAPYSSIKACYSAIKACYSAIKAYYSAINTVRY
jgi:hypothetical protein